jgi:hypothetical protein
VSDVDPGLVEDIHVEAYGTVINPPDPDTPDDEEGED